MIDPTEPVRLLSGIPIRECGEPLVDFLAKSPRLRLDRPRFRYRRELLARQGLADRLAEAAELLPDGYSFGIIECWRAPLIQRRMFRAVEAQVRTWFPDLEGSALRAKVEQLSAPLDDRVPPPHTTGGAVDLVLYDADGNPCDLHGPYDFHDPESFPFDALGLSARARSMRAMMRETLARTGITNYPSEYWHYSYGDQGWAYRGGHVAACYGSIQPDSFVPDPADDNDEPLEMILPQV